MTELAYDRILSTPLLWFKLTAVTQKPNLCPQWFLLLRSNLHLKLSILKTSATSHTVSLTIYHLPSFPVNRAQSSLSLHIRVLNPNLKLVCTVKLVLELLPAPAHSDQPVRGDVHLRSRVQAGQPSRIVPTTTGSHHLHKGEENQHQSWLQGGHSDT